MERDYLDFDVSIDSTAAGQVVRVTDSPAGTGQAAFSLPFKPVELAQFMIAVGPPRVASRRLVPAQARVVDVKDYGQRLGDALLAGDVGAPFRTSLSTAKQQGAGLRLRLGLEAAPDLEPVPWEYLYDAQLGRFLTLSTQTPIVRLPRRARRAARGHRRRAAAGAGDDLQPARHARARRRSARSELLRATTADLVTSGRLELVVLTEATLGSLQRALLETFHVFHFIGHGGFDQSVGEGVLVLEREDGTAHRVGGSRLGTLLHDARDLQLAVLNACEGARTSRPRRVLRRRPGPGPARPAGRRRHADGDLRPGRARLQPRVLLLPHPRATHRRRDLRGAQGDGHLRRGLRMGHRRPASAPAPTSPSTSPP